MADEKTPPPGDTGADTTTTPAAGDTTDDKGKGQGHMVPKSRLDAEIAKRRVSDEQLETIAKELEADVPEAFRDLIPSSLSAAERIKWLRAANAKGLFTAPEPLPTDHSKPKITKPAPSPDSLSSVQKMASGYGAKKG
jgi:hypothetical protein